MEEFINHPGISDEEAEVEYERAKAAGDLYRVQVPGTDVWVIYSINDATNQVVVHDIEDIGAN